MDRLRLALWVEKVDSPIGDENSFLYVHCFLPSVEKVDSPIGDEKQSDICYDFLRKVEKVDSPIGDEKSVFVMVLLSISSVEKVDSPIGDENFNFCSNHDFLLCRESRFPDRGRKRFG